MNLEKITPNNIEEAIETARQIFPYEIHNGEFWPQLAYKEAIQENRTIFAYYLTKENNITVGITGHYPPEDDKNEIWLGWFGVLPQFRRKGFGSKILIQTGEIISKFGCSMLYLYSGDRAEEYPAHRLYLRHGFKEYQRDKVDGSPVIYFKSELPLINMGKSVD